jgi:hypothetical protein
MNEDQDKSRPVSGTPVAAALVTLLFSGGAAMQHFPPPENVSVAGNGEPTVAPKSLTDEELTRRITGAWRLPENGEQFITNRPDGTATMVVKLNFVGSLLFGPRLDMELNWNVKGGVLTHVIRTGKPAASVKKLTEMFGEQKSYNILELTSNHLLLQEIDPPHDKFNWKPWGREVSRVP